MRFPKQAAAVTSIAVALVIGATSGSAGAATIDLGSGGATPNLVVDSAGTGYLTFADSSTNQVLRYCRIPAGGSACDVTRSFTYPSMVGGQVDSGNSPVLAGAGKVTLVDQRLEVAPFGQRFVFNSTDGGSTFTPVTPGAGNKVGQTSAGLHAPAVFAPGSSYDPGISVPTVLGIDDGAITNGPDFQETDAVPGGLTSAHFSMSKGTSTGASSVNLAGSTLIAAYEDLNGVVHSRRYNGSGGVNSDAAWAAAVNVGQAAAAQYRVQVLANGAGNPIYVAYPAASGAAAIARYDGTGWGAPVELTGASVGEKFGAYEDAAGIVHVVYVDADGALRYRYARTSANNDFTRPQTLAPAGASYFDPQVAVSASGSGFVTWTDGSSEHAMPVAPGEGPEDGTIDGDSTGIGGGTTIVLKVPKNCVLSGSPANVSVDVKKKKRHSKKGTKIKAKPVAVAFYADGKLISTDTKKPFEASIPTTGLAAGSKLEVSAKVTVKIKRKGQKAKKKVKTLKSTISIC